MKAKHQEEVAGLRNRMKMREVEVAKDGEVEAEREKALEGRVMELDVELALAGERAIEKYRYTDRWFVEASKHFSTYGQAGYNNSLKHVQRWYPMTNLIGFHKNCSRPKVILEAGFMFLSERNFPLPPIKPYDDGDDDDDDDDKASNNLGPCGGAGGGSDETSTALATTEEV